MVPRLRGSTTGEHRGTGGSDAAGGAAPTEGNVVGDGGTGGTIKTEDVVKKGGKIMGKYRKIMGKGWKIHYKWRNYPIQIRSLVTNVGNTMP